MSPHPRRRRGIQVLNRREEGGRAFLELVETSPVGGRPAVTITLAVATQVSNVPDASEDGIGGNVIVTNYGDITTIGAFAPGINAQSIGRGGAGGLAIAATVTGGTVMTAGISAAIGGTGDAGGDGDQIDIDAGGSVTTAQYFSTGLLSQSTGLPAEHTDDANEFADRAPAFLPGP